MALASQRQSKLILGRCKKAAEIVGDSSFVIADTQSQGGPVAKRTKKAKKEALIRTQFVKVDQGDTHFYLTKLPAGVLAEITYASIRGQDDEEGAVQRILNTRRISSIADFVTSVGHFPNSIVLNWVNTKKKISIKGDKIEVPKRACALSSRASAARPGTHTA
jgi:hypothetical protein